jgi:hypothetical protein
MRMMADKTRDVETEDGVIEAFQVFDKDGRGRWWLLLLLLLLLLLIQCNDCAITVIHHRLDISC